MSAVFPADAAALAGADTLVVDTTTQTFAKDVLEESRRRPVLVDFWAPWCGPCKTLGPVIEKAVRAAKGAVRLVKMNIDEHPAVAGQLGIQSIPAVIAFANGQPVDGFVGALPESQVKAFIVDVGGFLGIGEKSVAIDAENIDFRRTKDGDLVLGTDGVPVRYTLPGRDELAGRVRKAQEQARREAEQAVEEARERRTRRNEREQRELELLDKGVPANFPPPGM